MLGEAGLETVPFEKGIAVKPVGMAYVKWWVSPCREVGDAIGFARKSVAGKEQIRKGGERI